MGNIASWFNELAQTKQVNLIVEDTMSLLKQRSGFLDPYFPIQEYDDRNFLEYIVEEIIPLASVISFGAKIPVTQHGKIRKITSQMVKIALSYVYDENRQWALYEAMKLARMQSGALGNVYDMALPNGEVIKGVNNTLGDFLFSKPESLVRSVMDTLLLFSWQCGQFAQVDFVDPRSNTRTILDWKDPDATYNHFPTALSNTSNADAKTNIWTDYEFANGVYLLEDALETYRETNGFYPDAIAMSPVARKHLMRQKKVVELARQAYAYSDTAQVDIDPTILNKIMDRRELPPIVVNDERYRIEDSTTGETTVGRFLNSNRYVFLKEGMGERAIGVTIESKEGLYDDPKTGVYVRTFEESKSPVVDRSEAIATALPILKNPKLAYSQQVFA